MKKEMFPKISRVDVLALATDLAHNATNDQIIINEDYSELSNGSQYSDDEDLFEDDGITYVPEVQKVFNGWLEFYLSHIEACTEPEEAQPVKDYVFLIKDSTGHAIATISACKDEILNEKFKEAVNEHFMTDLTNDLNIVPLSMNKIQLGETHGVLTSIAGISRMVYIESILNY